MLWILYAISIAALYWIYDGYGRCLSIAVAVQTTLSNRLAPRSHDLSDNSQAPTVAVLLTVHNEQSSVAQRILNILACRYPEDRLRVVVASDGSTDNTNQIVADFDDPRVHLTTSPGMGKTATQNEALQNINSEVVVFTDADTKFDPDFIAQVVKPLSNPNVGAVDGRLLYTDPSDDATVQGQGFYWKYELGIRHHESQLGCLAVVTGASFAVRRQLILNMDPSIGEDCIVPLDVVGQGFQVVHQPTAKAYDSFEEGNGVTFKRRVRMTLRNWQGTWSRPRLLNPLQHPGYAFALWSHKVLRWLSPFFFMTATACSIGLCLFHPNIFAAIALSPFAGILSLSCVGQIGNIFGKRIPLSGTAFSFVLANAAFFVGVFKAIGKHRIQSYQTVIDAEATPQPTPASVRSAA